MKVPAWDHKGLSWSSHTSGKLMGSPEKALTLNTENLTQYKPLFPGVGMSQHVAWWSGFVSCASSDSLTFESFREIRKEKEKRKRKRSNNCFTAELSLAEAWRRKWQWGVGHLGSRLGLAIWWLVWSKVIKWAWNRSEVCWLSQQLAVSVMMRKHGKKW